MLQTIEELKSNLLTRFDIDCFVNIESLERSASSTLYQTLIPFVKEAYHDRYRFVFFNFSSVTINTLNHVFDTISYLDISPYFIEVVTDQTNTVDFFQQRNIKVTHQSILRPNFNLDKHMCAYVWAGLHIDPNGQARICCDYNGSILDENNQPYNIRTHNIGTIVNSNYMIKKRQEFRQGHMPSECNSCVRSESNGGESRRYIAPYKLKNVYGSIDWESDTVTPKFLGGHFGNLCNLKCRICGPYNSSSIAAEQLEHVSASQLSTHPTYQLLEQNRWSKNSQAFWESTKEQLASLRSFEFLGGEPLMLKENLEFMQYLLDTGRSQDSIFEFVTNGTQFPKILESADRFKRLTFTISIDAIGDQFEYQRKNAKWNKVIENVQKFVSLKSLNPLIMVGVSITVNIQNVLYLPELILWINTQGFDHYYYNILTYPNYLSISNLTSDAQQLVLDRLTHSNLDVSDQSKLNYVINYIRTQPTSDGVEFVKKITEVDQIRNEDFRTSHKEIAQAMGFVL
jgi:MoaA/NifB/PqqE/SkfB family radical SAM enzyme